MLSDVLPPLDEIVLSSPSEHTCLQMVSRVVLVWQIRRASSDMRPAGGTKLVKAFTQSRHVTGARTVISDPLASSVASCACVSHSRLLDSNCSKLSVAASCDSRGRYLIRVVSLLLQMMRQ